MAFQNAKTDRNNVPGLTFHSGTSDDSETIRWSGQTSGAADVHVTGGTIDVDITGADVVSVSSGTQETLGTVGVVESGTVDIGAFVDIPGGTIDLVSVLGNLNAGTITSVESLPDLQGGTVDLITEISNLAGGTVVSTPDSSDIDVNNVTTTPLGGDATYTGTATDCEGYSNITTTIYADVDSATDGMKFEFCSDNSFGSNTDTHSFTLTASDSTVRRFQFPVTARYYRVRYINDSGAQGGFDIQTILHRTNVLTSIHRVSNTLTVDRSAELVRAVIAGQTTAGGGAMINVKVNPSGAVQVDGNIEVDVLPDLPGGTIDLVTLLGSVTDVGQVHNAGTIAALPDLPGGTIDSIAADVGVKALTGAFLSTATSISTSAAPLPATALSNRKSVVIYNNGATTMFLGGSAVATSDGLPVPPGEFSQSFDCDDTMILYGRVDSGTEEARVLELSDA